MESYPDYRAAFTATFGEELLGTCWHSPWVQSFMNVRDSIMSHGANVAPLLSHTEHDIVVINGQLKIRHNDNMLLVDQLYPIIEQFIEAVTKL